MTKPLIFKKISSFLQLFICYGGLFFLIALISLGLMWVDLRKEPPKLPVMISGPAGNDILFEAKHIMWWEDTIGEHAISFSFNDQNEFIVEYENCTPSEGAKIFFEYVKKVLDNDLSHSE